MKKQINRDVKHQMKEVSLTIPKCKEVHEFKKLITKWRSPWWKEWNRNSWNKNIKWNMMLRHTPKYMLITSLITIINLQKTNKIFFISRTSQYQWKYNQTSVIQCKLGTEVYF